MNSVNTVFIEGEAEQQVLELSTLLDQYAKLPETLPEDQNGEFTTQVKQHIQENNWNKVFEVLIDNTELLFKAEDSQFEGSFNLLLSCFRLVEDDQLISLVEKFTQFISQSEDSRGYLKLKVLENLYNSVEPKTEYRYIVLKSILQVVKRHQLYDAILAILPNLKTWIKSWKVDTTKARDMYIAIYETLKAGEHNVQAYEFILSYLTSFPSDQVDDQAKQYGQAALKEAISTPEVLNFEDLFLTAPVQALSELPLYNLAKIFLDQDLAQYLSFVESNANLVQELGLNKENDVHKLRLLTLTNLGTERISVPISYSEIASKLQIEADEVEVWVIDVIRYGLIEAKINQHDQTVTISRATHRSFTKNNWENLDQALTNWKDSLHQVIQILKTSSSQFQQQANAINQNASKSSQ